MSPMPPGHFPTFKSLLPCQGERFSFPAMLAQPQADSQLPQVWGQQAQGYGGGRRPRDLVALCWSGPYNRDMLEPEEASWGGPH